MGVEYVSVDVGDSGEKGVADNIFRIILDGFYVSRMISIADVTVNFYWLYTLFRN